MFNYLCLFEVAAKKIQSVALILLTVILAILFVVLFTKYATFRWISGILITIVLCFTMVFSIVHLNKYYNTKGGIIGKIESIFDPTANIEQKENQVSIDFKSVVMKKKSDNIWSAEFVVNDIVKLDEKLKYEALVNDIPCRILENSDIKNSISFSYTYSFLDENYKEILTDTLKLNFAFYDTGTRLIVTTEGGEKAVNEWNAYFSKNKFNVKLIASDTVFEVVDDSVKINLIVNGASQRIVKISKGADFILPDDIQVDGYRINYWTKNGQKVGRLTSVKEDTTLIADVTKLYKVTFYKNYENDINSDLYLVSNFASEDKISVSVPERTNFKFLGWSIDKINIISSEFNLTADTTLFALWKAEKVNYNFKFDSNVEIVVNEITYNSNFTVFDDYDKKIIVSEVFFENYSLSNFEVLVGDKTIIVNDLSFNKSMKELFEEAYSSEFDIVGNSIPKVIAIDIIPVFVNLSENIEDWLDSDLRCFIARSYAFNFSSFEVKDWTNEQVIDELYFKITYDDSKEKSLIEKELSISNKLKNNEMQFNVTEETTTREFLEYIVKYIKSLVDSN